MKRTLMIILGVVTLAVAAVAGVGPSDGPPPRDAYALAADLGLADHGQTIASPANKPTRALLIIGLGAALMLGFNTAFIPGPIDEATRLESSITKTADFNGTALDLGEGFAPSHAGQPFSAVIDTSAFDFTTTDETYAFKVQESSDNSAWTDASPLVSVTAVGVIAIPAFISKRYVRVLLDVGGTTPSITYEAWLVPHQN